MAVKLVTPPAIEPVSLADARKHLRLDSASLSDDLMPVYSLAPASRSPMTATGTAVDVLGYDVLVMLEAGACAVDATLDVHLEESDDNTTWTDVVGGAFARVTTANDDKTYTLEYTGGKRYIHAVAIVAVGSCVFGVTVIKKGAANTEDGLIQGMIVAAREWCETFTRRAFITQSWKQYLDAWPCGDEILLYFGRLQTVASIKYKDVAGVQATLDPSTYIVDSDSEPGRIVLAYGKSWPSGMLYPVNPIEVEFTCGYGATAASVPQSIRNAMLLLVGHWYNNREAVIVGQVSKEIEFTVSALLWPHRIFWW